MKDRVDRHFDLLHPEFKTLTSREKFRTRDDQEFIFDNIDQIDREFRDKKR